MKPLTRFTFIILCCQTLALVGVSAQENDNQEHWSFLENKAISNDANWLAYILNYPELETDTLFVIATSSDKRFKIPQSKMGMFSEDSQWFVGRGFPNNYHFINLVSNRQFFRDAVTEVYFSPNNGSMLLYHPEQNRLHSTGNHPVEDVCLEMITDLAFHNTTGKLALVQQQKDGLYKLLIGDNLDNLKTIKTTPFPILDLIWDSTATHLAFYVTDTTKGTAEIVQIKLNPEKMTTWQMPINRLPQNPHRYLRWSNNGKALFFAIACPNDEYSKTEAKPQVEVWQSYAKVLPPFTTALPQPYRHFDKVWFAETGQVNTVTTASLPYMLTVNNSNYGIVYKHSTQNPYFSMQPAVDVYIKNLKNENLNVLVKGFKGDINTINITPSGNLVTYFEKGEWWSYHTGNHKRYRLSENIGEDVADNTYDLPGEVKPYGLAGFVNESEDLLLYGEFDLWRVSPDGKRAERLTSGAKTKLRYRLLHSSPYGIVFHGQNSPNLKPIDLNKGVLLSVTGDDYSTGVQKYSHKGIEPIIMEEAYIDEVVCNQDLNNCSYISQTYHSPPALWHLTSNSAPEKIMQSNPQVLPISFRKPDLLHYKGIDGKPLKAALFYPNNYQESIVYPMIVSIYERRSKLVHNFFLPIENQHDGFSPSRFTADGYLVLMPDISYEIGKPGNSALHAVNNAVDEAIAKKVVDEQNIGIIGHSFGGYQAAYIIAKSQRFKTAVLGAPISDPIGAYHSMLAFGKDNLWRYENYQMRMGFPFYENPQAYIENSPLYLSSEIQTPVMLWSGKNDSTVDPNQSIALFLALRRRAQKATLYLYHDEPHVLYKKENQIDLSRRIKSWMDYYLK